MKESSIILNSGILITFTADSIIMQKGTYFFEEIHKCIAHLTVNNISRKISISTINTDQIAASDFNCTITSYR